MDEGTSLSNAAKLLIPLFTSYPFLCTVIILAGIVVYGALEFHKIICTDIAQPIVNAVNVQTDEFRQLRGKLEDVVVVNRVAKAK